MTLALALIIPKQLYILWTSGNVHQQKYFRCSVFLRLRCSMLPCNAAVNKSVFVVHGLAQLAAAVKYWQPLNAEKMQL